MTEETTTWSHLRRWNQIIQNFNNKKSVFNQTIDSALKHFIQNAQTLNSTWSWPLRVRLVIVFNGFNIQTQYYKLSLVRTTGHSTGETSIRAAVTHSAPRSIKTPRFNLLYLIKNQRTVRAEIWGRTRDNCSSSWSWKQSLWRTHKNTCFLNGVWFSRLSPQQSTTVRLIQYQITHIQIHELHV